MMRLEPWMNEGEGEILVGEDVRIGNGVAFNISERMTIGPRSVIGDNAIIEGRDIEIGPECWMNRYVQIGGGSCMEHESKLRIGCFGHLGRGVFINTAAEVLIGDEVGLGTDTKLYTHGAYLSALNGFPVEFGNISIADRVWIPGATVLPGVDIGHDSVIAVGSVVNRWIPPGCLAGGVPVKILKKDAYPNPLDADQRAEFLNRLMLQYFPKVSYWFKDKGLLLGPSGTIFNFDEQRIEGHANAVTERIKNQLRRNGIRFKSYAKDGEYVPW